MIPAPSPMKGRTMSQVQPHPRKGLVQEILTASLGDDDESGDDFEAELEAAFEREPGRRSVSILPNRILTKIRSLDST